MLTKEYEGSMCEVKTLRNVLITVGRVDKIEESELEIADPSGPLPIISYKTPVKVAVFNSELGFRMVAGQIYMSSAETLRVVNVLDFLEYERRRFFRLDLDSPGTLLLPVKDEEGADTGEVEKVPVRVKNLSLCGAMFETDRVFHAGDEVPLQMVLYRDSVEVMTTVVQRIREWVEGQYTYGVEIVNLEARIEQNLCAYLFEQQRLQIQRNRTRM